MNTRSPGRGPLRALLAAPLAAVLAALVTACGGGGDPPPPEEPPLELSSISRSWKVDRYLGSSRALSELISHPESRIDEPGLVGDEYELGGLAFNAPDGGDAIARLELFSNADGMTYWAGAQAPSGALGDGRAVGGRVSYSQHQRWRKNAVDATLKYVITELRLDLIDGNLQSLTFAECPWGDGFTVSDCRDTMYARVLFGFSVRADRDPSNPRDGFETLMGRDGIAQLNGWVGNWEHEVGEDWWGAWEPKDFLITYDHDGNGSKRHAHVKLIKPLVLEVPLGKLPIGAEILVDTELTVEAMNNRRRESYAGAWFRDPARTGGVGFIVSGLEPVPLVDVPPADPRPDPSPACPGPADPAAGAIAFESADFFSAELPLGARIVLVREGGNSGDASVELRTSDGSAHAGSDYVATTQRVWFRDGQTRRVLHLPLLLDGVAEPNETLGLRIADPRGCAELGTQRTATLTIRDDDRPAPTPAPTFTVGGTVSGLAGTGLVLRDQARAVSLPVAADGRFVFPGRYASGAAYDVRVGTQPSNPTQVCRITRGRGTVAADVDDIAVACSAPPPASGLDPTFGSGGRVTAGPAGAAKAIALQADGRIVAAIGNTLARYLPDGTPDATFGTQGRVTEVLGSSNAGAEILDLAVQPDGRIVAAGRARGTSQSPLAYDFAAARFEPDGARDPGFNGGQPLQVDWIGAPDHAHRVLLQPDGKIVLAGIATTLYTSTTDDSAMGLVRLNADGSLDAGFGNGGRAVAEFAQLDFGYAAALQADGKLLVAGRVSQDRGDESDVGIARFNPDGTLDAGFGNGGRVIVDLSPNGDEASALALQPDGRILLAVAYNEAGNFAFGVLRLNADGSRDSGFGSNGFAFRQIGPGADTPAALVLQADGRIVVAGSALDSATSYDAIVARFLPDGTPDAGFGSGGFHRFDTAQGRDGGYDLLVQPDGKLLMSGSAGNGLAVQPLLVRIVP
ncbi:MAG: hypothetical protein KIT35_14190 [Piscinibacter sp.]|uniref:Calx-beta domain-containing protein n=1 Tax=Piscinibacter sp. TaxID=1903157 RepID=UPI002587AD67|nr:Calx-beta domain-containing protein [Piscinibacter sp.]MCW5664984.1 hypothetical protein [Piscinibacter sp.]